MRIHVYQQHLLVVIKRRFVCLRIPRRILTVTTVQVIISMVMFASTYEYLYICICMHRCILLDMTYVYRYTNICLCIYICVSYDLTPIDIFVWPCVYVTHPDMKYICIRVMRPGTHLCILSTYMLARSSIFKANRLRPTQRLKCSSFLDSIL